MFYVRAQLERTCSAKLDEMLSFQKSAFDMTGLGYEFSISPNIASSSKLCLSHLLMMIFLRMLTLKLN